MLSAGCVTTPQGIHETLFNFSGTTIPIPGERNSDAYHTNGVPGFPGEHEEREAVEEEMTHRKRQESDFMLAQVYHELARASQDMAIWSRATAVGASPYLSAYVTLWILDLKEERRSIALSNVYCCLYGLRVHFMLTS